MPEDAGRRPDNTTGRKRDEERTGAILEAAADLLLEVGFDRIRTQDIAERAGAGKGAIYRRWATKEALLAEAIRNMPAGEAPVKNVRLANRTRDTRGATPRPAKGLGGETTELSKLRTPAATVTSPPPT